MQTQKVVCWGAGRRLKHFLDTYCGPGKLLPKPDFICDSTRTVGDSEYVIPSVTLEQLIEMNPEQTTIIVTAGLFDLQAQIIPSELYYFPLYHRRSFEMLHFLENEKQKLEEVLGMLADEKSKEVYQNVFNAILDGSFIRQSLYTRSAYFGNDLIATLPNNSTVAFAGAFNGKHIERALRNNSSTRFHAFEPNKKWYTFLCDKFRNNNAINIYNRILWKDTTTLAFDGDSLNHGLDAHVAGTADIGNTGLDAVQTTTIDAIDDDTVSMIILDVEGSEANALDGARQTIAQKHPVLAVCLYHEMEDFINLPFKIASLATKPYQLHVRHHSVISAIETVLYAL